MKLNQLRVLSAGLISAALVLASTSFVYSGDDEAAIKRACAELMGSEADLLNNVDSLTSVSLERRSLVELLSTGPDSLLYKSPWTIMNSAQRALHLIYGEGVREVSDRRAGHGTLNRYAFFSDAVDLADGEFMVGHLSGIAKLVSHIEASADGQPGKDHIPTLVGPPGTGKSRILTMFRKGLLNATIKREEYYVYTFEWVGLNQFPALVGKLPSAVTRSENPEAFADPANDSPFTLMPEAVQARILAANAERIRSLIGRDPRPKRDLNPQSKDIRDAIIQYYTAKKGSPLTAQEEVLYLSKHVRMKRLVLGYQNTAPYLANQGKEPNLARLFGSNNPLVKATFGHNDPFAVHYGIFASANGGIVFIDEIGKNEPSLIGQFLNLFSSHVVEVAPGVNVPSDLLMFSASNTKEIYDLRAKDPQNPLLSRMDEISWPYVIFPDEVGRVLAMEIQNLKARPLNTGGMAEYVDIKGKDVFKLYPEVQPFQPVVTPHGRFALKIEGAGKKDIFISPHALEFMANVVTLTRLNFNPDKVKHGERFPMVSSKDAIFANPIVRLRVLLGQKPVTEAQLEDLNNLSISSAEGDYGMDHRDVERWWRDVVSRAQTAAHGSTITPIILFDVLREKALGNKIFVNNRPEQEKLLLFAQHVFHEFIAPAIKEDLNMAFVRSEGREVMDRHYDEIVQELLALGLDPKATRYIAYPSNQPRTIDRERLQKVAQKYQEKQGRPLSPEEIATWQMFMSRQEDPSRATQRNPTLLSAIAAYQADQVLQKEKTTLKRLLDVADNTASDAKAAERARASELMKILEEELGYNLHSAKVAIETLANLEANRSQTSPE